MDWGILLFHSANMIKVLCVRTLYTISNISMPVL